MSIDSIYKPFNFSTYGVYVIKTNITHTGATKIEDTLPLHIKTIKGICITCSANNIEKTAGYITLNFNEGILKNVQLPIMPSSILRHQSHPIPLNEHMKSNSIIQGYFFSRVQTKRVFTITIYLHYEK
jgi:hypothetical protein